MERGVYRSYYKGHKDKTKGEGRGGGGRWDWLGWGGGVGRKMQTIVTELKKKQKSPQITGLRTLILCE